MANQTKGETNRAHYLVCPWTDAQPFGLGDLLLNVVSVYLCVWCAFVCVHICRCGYFLPFAFCPLELAPIKRFLPSYPHLSLQFDYLVWVGRGQFLLEESSPLMSGNGDTTHNDDDLHQLSQAASLRACELAEHLLRLARQRVQWATAASRWLWTEGSTHSTIYDSLDNKTHVETVQRLRRLRFWFVQLRQRLITSVG